MKPNKQIAREAADKIGEYLRRYPEFSGLNECGVAQFKEFILAAITEAMDQNGKLMGEMAAKITELQAQSEDTKRLEFWISKSRFANYSIRLSRRIINDAETWHCDGNYVNENADRVEFSGEGKTPREAIDAAMKGET